MHETHRTGASPLLPHACSRAHPSGCSNTQKQARLVHGCKNGGHPMRILTRPNDIGSNAPGTIAGFTGAAGAKRAAGGADAPARQTASPIPISMHVENPPAACPFVQVIHVLCHDGKLSPAGLLQSRQGLVRRVWLGRIHGIPSLVVKLVHELGVPSERFWCGHVGDAMICPFRTGNPSLSS
jgi:hypothetical protein